MAIEDWRVSNTDLSRMSHDDDLSSERNTLFGRLVSIVRGNHSSLDIFNRNSLGIETNIISWGGLVELLVMLLDTLDFTGDITGLETDGNVSLKDTSLDSSDTDGSDTSDFVGILDRKSQRLVTWSDRGR